MNAYREALARARTLMAITLTVGASTGLWAQREECTTQCAAKGMWADEVSVKLDKGIENMPGPEMLEALNRISAASGVPFRLVFTLYRVGGPEFDGAFARLEPENKRVIYYGRGFEDKFASSDGPDLWYGYVVLAHEMAHHLAKHTFHQGLLVKEELQADRFAGCMTAALKRMGVIRGSAKNITAIYEQHAPVEASGSHPGRAARIERVNEGWKYGGAPPDSPHVPAAACFKMKKLE